VGGLLGIDPSSYDRDAAKRMQEEGGPGSVDSGVFLSNSAGAESKIQLLRRDE
jgi:hypothetical protein